MRRPAVMAVLASAMWLAGARDGLAQPGTAGVRDFAAELQRELRTVATAAGREYPLTVLQLCFYAPSVALDTVDAVPPYLRPGGYTEPPRDRWYVAPQQVFDNLYFVGDRDQSAWALTTPDGIVLFDTNIHTRTDTVIVDGLRRVGLDPRAVKYVLVSHAHNDHLGGVRAMQERYGARVVLSAPDWDLLARYPKRYDGFVPRRDVVVADGDSITLGGTSITAWLTPGHTKGTLSFTFPVLDRGRRLMAVYSGGTGFNFPNDTPELGIPAFQTYIDSQRRIAERAASVGATVFLTNHSSNDNALVKMELMRGRGDRRHPFDIGVELVQRYFRTTAACARVAQLRLEQLAATGAR